MGRNSRLRDILDKGEFELLTSVILIQSALNILYKFVRLVVLCIFFSVGLLKVIGIQKNMVKVKRWHMYQTGMRTSSLGVPPTPTDSLRSEGHFTTLHQFQQIREDREKELCVLCPGEGPRERERDDGNSNVFERPSKSDRRDNIE